MKNKFLVIGLVLSCHWAMAQTNKKPVEVSGSMGVSYDYYGLTTHPGSPAFFSARRPWNLVRFNFNPTFTIGQVKLPVNINVSPMNYNYNGIGGYWPSNIPRPKQTLGQWLTNPINNIGLNPTYKWAEVQLGTQYLMYSPLSTGDLGVFGGGFSLRPGKLRLKFFHGISQRKQDPIYTPLPGVLGMYRRKQTMAQIGVEKEAVYFAGFNIVKSKDIESSIPPIPAINKPPQPDPQEATVATFLLNVKDKSGWYFNTELGNSFYSRDINNMSAPLVNNGTFKGLAGLLNPRTSTIEGFATQTAIGRKSKYFDIALHGRFFSKGYYTAGYPYLQNDRLEYTVSTRISSKNSKYLFNGDIGRRFTNWSGARNKQLIANANIFSQFTDQFSVNASYNNFGFQAPAVGMFMGMKNVANDLSINPTYSWSNTKMSNLLSASYSWSKYDETLLPAATTTNNTQSVLVMYVPVFFNHKLSPDFSALWFENHVNPGNIKLRLYTGTAGFTLPLKKPKMNLKGQIQYTNTKLQAFTPSNNWLATTGFSTPLSKKLTWNLSGTLNLLKYGNELVPPASLLGANYLESRVSTSLQYRFGK